MTRSILIFGVLTFTTIAAVSIVIPALLIAVILLLLGVVIFLLVTEQRSQPKPRPKFDPLEQAEKLSKDAKDKAHLN
jgi:hypothetical protein